jgi:peroxiredoxin 2/4
MQDEFKKLKTALIVISTDGLNSHIEWINSMESMAVSKGNPVKIGFPLIADSDLKISMLYGLLQRVRLKEISGVLLSSILIT